MQELRDLLKTALVQASPVMFDKEKSTAKAVSLIQKASAQRPDLIVFPELFIPGYPYGLTFGFTIGSRSETGRADYKLYYDQSILIPGPETSLLGNAAKEADSYLSIGVSERDPLSGTLYNSNILFRPDGTIDAVHRKIKPTGAERLIWGDCHTEEHYFPVTETPWGRWGALICWESYMPLARTALYEKGISVYIAPNTNDNPEWQNTIRHIALEGRCYVINADMIIKKTDYPCTLNEQEHISNLPDQVCRGGSCIIDPYGHPVTEPVWEKECILHAHLKMQNVPASRMEFDPCGHYARPDILSLR